MAPEMKTQRKGPVTTIARKKHNARIPMEMKYRLTLASRSLERPAAADVIV
jgi:hypothetical protein